ncbi:D-isomer specific 2-hydroxyacid dehydrogenase [Hyaloraphidium curvatum]|nr:D-isomer specific 2-hydroxyacid dehydrogenase [Hyaloraphidium curvatum]
MSAPAEPLRLFLTRPLEKRASELLARQPDVRLAVSPSKSRDEIIAGVSELKPHGLICFATDTKIDGALLDACGPQLRVVSTVSVGTDHVDKPAVKARGAKLANTPGVVAGPTAEIALALALMACRRIKEAAFSCYFPDGAGQEPDPRGGASGGELGGEWNPRLASTLAARTCGIVGLGNIGVEVAKRLRGFGVDPTVLYSGSGGAKPDSEARSGGACRHVALDELFRESDVIFITCSLNEKTRGMVDARLLALAKPTAVLVNVARGGIVDTEALVDALRGARLAAAGLDVTDPEPLPAGHPLLKMRNVVVLPHMGTDAEEVMEDMAVMAAENALRGARGQPLLAEVQL